MSRLSAGLLSSASYARRGEKCVRLRWCASDIIPGDQGGRRDASEATPVNVEARGQSRRCLLRFLLLTFGPAGVYLLFSRRFFRLDSSSLFLFPPLSIALSMSLGDISFPFRSAGLPYPSRASSSSLCLDRRRSHQRSPLSRGLLGDPTLCLRCVAAADNRDAPCHRGTSTPRSVYSAYVNVRFVSTSREMRESRFRRSLAPQTT